MSSITIVLPTHNQSSRLSTMLEMLTTSITDCQILVVDSSAIEQSSFGVVETGAFRYVYLPKMGFFEKLAYALSLVHSEHVLLHPDGELLNPDALRFIDEHLKPQHASTVALNLTLISRASRTEIAFRNFQAFPIRQLNGRKKLDQCLAPYHQMVWGVHKTKLLHDFFISMSALDWTKDKGNHAMLLERACNFYMYSQGEILACVKPLFMRMPKVRNADFEVLSLLQWMDGFLAGCESKSAFFNDLGDALARLTKKSPEVVKHELREAITNEWLLRRRGQNFFARLRRRILRMGKGHCYSISASDTAIRISALRDEVPSTQFKRIARDEIAPWALKAKKWFFAYQC